MSNINYLKWLEIAPGLPGVAENIYGKYSDVCPSPDLVFRALELVAPLDVRVVILGQDPYHTHGKASGLAFGYHPNYTGHVDSSLENILTEVEACSSTRPDNSLVGWANQGVLLLNTRLTVEAGKPMSHAGLGWETEIDKILRYLAQHTDTIFVGWGKEAQEAIDKAEPRGPDLYIATSHPCKFSAHRGFLGSRCFSRINDLLMDMDSKPINWGVK